MKVGLAIPNHWGIEDPADLVAIAELAEALGFESLWVADHLLNVGAVEARLGAKPYYHPLAVLSFVASRTTRIRLGTSVLVLPYHAPIELAKYAATLDRLSGERLVLGVAPGWLPEEFAALGIPIRERGERTDETIEILRALWSGSRVSHAGRHWRFSDVVMTPRPARRIPIWTGGNSRAALERAARLGDGWHPSNTGSGLLSPTIYAEGRATVTALASAWGRNPGGLAWSLQLGIDIDGRTSGAPLLPRGAAIASACAAYEAAGAEHVVLAPLTGRVDAFRAVMREIADALLAPAATPD